MADNPLRDWGITLIGPHDSDKVAAAERSVRNVRELTLGYLNDQPWFHMVIAPDKLAYDRKAVWQYERAKKKSIAA